MLDRIIGALTFRKGIYNQVANDAAFTSSAWLIVLVAGALNQFGTHASTISNGFFRWIIGSIVLTGVAVGVFALSAFVVSWLAKAMFHANVTFDQMMRALGLAYVWRAIGAIGIVSAITPLLLCVLSPITLIAGIAGFIADLLAIKDSSGMDWTGTIVTVIVSTILTFVVIFVAGFILIALRLLV